MLHDITIGTNDMARAVRFWEAIMSLLGQDRLPEDDAGWVCWGQPLGQGLGLCLCPTFDGKPASAGNGTMFTFAARDAAQVRGFYATALAHGGTDEGAPGTRARYSPDFYVAYVRDPDGHKLACVYPYYDPTTDQA